MMDKERIEARRDNAQKLADANYSVEGKAFWRSEVELCDLAIKGLETGNTARKDVPGLIETLGHQKQCDEDGTECIVSRQAVDEAITILKGLEQKNLPAVDSQESARQPGSSDAKSGSIPDGESNNQAIIGCALEQAAKACSEHARDYRDFDSDVAHGQCAAGYSLAKEIRSINEPALKAWEGMKKDAERYRWLRDDKRDVEINVPTMNAVCENALDVYIDERAKDNR